MIEIYNYKSVVHFPEAGQPFDIVNPCTDFGFKKAFYNPMVLIDFLNHILDYKGIYQIVELYYMDKDFPSFHQLYSDFTVDIVCKTQNDRYYIIEMMYDDDTVDYVDKAFVESARFLSRVNGEQIHDLSMGDNRKRRRIGQTDINAKDFWQQIEEVCTLVISNKRLNPETMKSKYPFETNAESDIINIAYPTRYLENLETKVVLVMLANFNKTEDQLTTDIECWFFALKDEQIATGKSKISAFKNVSDITKTVLDSKALKQFYAELYKSSIGYDLLIDYEKRIQEYNDVLHRNFVDGEETAALRIAKALKAQNVEVSTIVTATGIRLEVIETL